MSIFGRALALLARAAFGHLDGAAMNFTFRLTATGPDGAALDGGERTATLPEPRSHGAVRLATVLLFAALTAAAASSGSWEMTLAPLVIGRVTTAGLNALLSSTLANSVTSATWYVGLCKYVANDGVTLGTTAFSSASGTFVAGDVGRQILLRGAGAAGGDLLTTIAAVGSNTSITLGAAASNSATGVQYAFECRLADTMASHTSFTESAAYSNVTRPAWTPGAVSAGSVSNAASQAAFNMNATDFIFGAFLTSNNTISGTTGTLYGMGVNSGGVALAVTSGATVNVTITATVTAT